MELRGANFREINALQSEGVLNEIQTSLGLESNGLEAISCEGIDNATFNRVINSVVGATTFFDPYAETGLLSWIKDGFPSKYILHSGTRLVFAKNLHSKDKTLSKGAKGVSDGKTALVDFDDFPSREACLYSIAIGTEDIRVRGTQHEVLHVPINAWSKAAQRRAAFLMEPEPYAPEDVLIESFAYRFGDRVIELYSQDEVKRKIYDAKFTNGENAYKVEENRLDYCIRSMDTLSALYSIDAKIGSGSILKAITRLVISTAEEGGIWNGNCFVTIQGEIDQEVKRVGIKPDEVNDLIERYRKVRVIQRLAARLIVQEELKNIKKYVSTDNAYGEHQEAGLENTSGTHLSRLKNWAMNLLIK